MYKVLLFFCLGFMVTLFARAVNPPEKLILIKVDAAGLVSDGLDTISVDDLSEYVRERLFKNYTGTGKMYDRISLVKTSSAVEDLVIESLVKEIVSGQKKALADLCLHKYKKLFDALGEKQQKKIRKQFPVLFQEIKAA